MVLLILGCSTKNYHVVDDNLSYKEYDDKIRVYTFLKYTPSRLILHTHVDPTSKVVLNGLHDVYEIEVVDVNDRTLIVKLKPEYTWDDLALNFENILRSRIEMDIMDESFERYSDDYINKGYDFSEEALDFQEVK